jgi:hypothetical protein
MRAPPDNKGGRRLRAAADDLDTPNGYIHRSAEGATSVAATPDGRPVAYGWGGPA